MTDNRLVENCLTNLKHIYRENIDKEKSPIKSIYLYGSYPRNDFIQKHSDLDFAVFLDLSPSIPHWKYPEFLQIAELTQTIIKKTLPPDYLRSEGIDIVSLSLNELELAKKDALSSFIGPLKLLTFFAFDFYVYNRLLFGEDILQQMKNKIPDPRKFADERLQWIQKLYKRQEYSKMSDSFLLLTTLGSIIRHYAILNGITDISKESLRSWSLNANFWSHSDYITLEKYFNYIQAKHEENPINDPEWIDSAKKFIESSLLRNKK